MSKKIYVDIDLDNTATIINIPAPVNPGDLPNKQYVDSIATSSGFGRRHIRIDQVVVIPEDQQMIIKGQIKVEGHLRVLGDLVIIWVKTEQYQYQK